MKRTNNSIKSDIIQCHGLKKLNAIIEENLIIPEANILIDRDELISNLLFNLQELIKYPLKEISILVKLVEINENKENNILISEIKDLMKIVFLNYNYIIKLIKNNFNTIKNNDNFLHE